MNLKISDIHPDPDQPRRQFPPEHIEALAASIRANGLMQPIVVRADGKGYLIVAGECRWRAHRLLADAGDKRFAKIGALVQEPPSTIDLRVRQAAENILRADLTPLEEAGAFQQLVDLGLSPEDVAKRLGVSLARVETRLALLRLEPTIGHLLASGQIDKGTAIEIAKLPAHHEQMRIMHMVRRGELGSWHSVRKAVEAVAGQVTEESLFGDLPPAASDREIATVSAMERRIEAAARMLSAGWKDGECVVAAKVSRDRARLMADRIAALRSGLRHMENELRHVTAQAEIVLGDNVVQFERTAQ
ncbi:MAG TPA: ParB/RepB/Spo0J family partition protein [Propylenella sp.]